MGDEVNLRSIEQKKQKKTKQKTKSFNRYFDIRQD